MVWTESLPVLTEVLPQVRLSLLLSDSPHFAGGKASLSLSMNTIFRFRFLLLLAAAIGAPLVSQAQQWSQGDPSAQEQYAAELLNRYWANPPAFAPRYMDLYTEDSVIMGLVGGMQAFALSAGDTWTPAQAEAQYLSQYTATAAPVAPLALYPALSQQAVAVRETKPPSILQGSIGQNFQPLPKWANPPTALSPLTESLGNSMPGFLYHLEGNQPGFSGPNATGGTATVSAGNYPTDSDNGWLGFSTWLYAPGVVGPREFLLSANLTHLTYTSYAANPASKHLRLMGINIGVRAASPSSGNTLFTVYELENEALSTNDFPYGPANTVFITGACFVDSNHNGEYDPGEGIGGLKVSVNGSTWYAISASQGGFAVPVQTGSGAVTVTVTGTVGGQAVTQTQNVTIANDNVWQDFSFAPTRPAQSAVIPAGNGKAQFINLSTRGWATTGSGNLVAGFVISGPSNAQKTVLLRGVAASLGQFGISGALNKPLLTVYDAKGNVLSTVTTEQTAADLFNINAVNPNSKLRPIFNQVGAFQFVTSSGLYFGDTAVVLTLAPGSYTFALSPDPTTDPNLNAATATQGVAMVEIYDVSVTDGATLINISSRSQVVSGQGQLTAGFVVSGPSGATKRVLVRGVGPALTNFGITNPLPDPVLTIFNSDASVALTDQGWDWGSQGVQIAALSPALGAFTLPDPSPDCAGIASVGPGNHTAGVSSATSINGDIAIVEIYDADGG
jgi:hypothetical protein